MMKRFLAASAAFATVAALAAPAFATTVPAPTSTFTINGTVNAVCNTGTLPTGAQSVTFTTPLNNADGTLNTGVLAATNVPLGNMWCNGAGSTVDVTATPLALTGNVTNPDTGHFTDRVDYQLSASFNGHALPVTVDTVHAASKTTAVDTGAQTIGIFDGAVAASASSDNSSPLKLIAGGYQATVTVTVTPG